MGPVITRFFFSTCKQDRASSTASFGADGAMSKRERENPCRVRGSRREEGGVCGRRVPSAFERPTQQDFPPPFPQRSSWISSTLDNASSGEILKALGVTHVLDNNATRRRHVFLSTVCWEKNRSHAIVISYLMKCKGWPLARSFQWIKIGDLSPV